MSRGRSRSVLRAARPFFVVPGGREAAVRRQDAGREACARHERGGVAGRARADASRLRGRNVREGALSKEQGHRPFPGNSLKKFWNTGPSRTLMYLHRPYLVSSEKVTPRHCIFWGARHIVSFPAMKRRSACVRLAADGVRPARSGRLFRYVFSDGRSSAGRPVDGERRFSPAGPGGTAEEGMRGVKEDRQAVFLQGSGELRRGGTVDGKNRAFP